MLDTGLVNEFLCIDHAILVMKYNFLAGIFQKIHPFHRFNGSLYCFSSHNFLKIFLYMIHHLKVKANIDLRLNSDTFYVFFELQFIYACYIVCYIVCYFGVKYKLAYMHVTYL